MQPNGNRPVYIVQPSNITHLNVRPTIITTGGQQLQPQPQQPVYQISTIRQPVIPQQTSSLYQIQGQPRLVSSSPVYTSLPTQRFATSPQTILAANANISPRLITPSSAPRMPMVSSQPLRPTLATVSTPPMSTSAPTPTTASSSSSSQPAAAGSKEFSVRVSKTRAQYGIMEFASGISIDVKDWKAIEMRREINPYTYRPASTADQNASSTSITTSLGVVIPKTGAGSEYGREQKEALKRKRYATKGTNIEDLPWLFTDRSSSEKKLKHYRGMKKGGITTNSSYYVFIQGKDGFEAYPVEDWYAFSPTNVYKTLDFDEAEKQFQQRHKNLSKWFLKHQVAKDKTNDDEIENDDEGGGGKGKKSGAKNKRDFKLLDAEDWVNEREEEEEEDDDEPDEDNNDNNKKTKTNKKTTKKTTKDAWTLSDDDEDEVDQTKVVKKAKTTKRQTSEDQGEDSDDGDHEGDEIEYTSDETSEDEDDIKDAGTVKSSMKYEVKGIDEEMKTMPDMEKRLEQMDENGDDFDYDDDDEEIEIDENEDENGKTAADDLAEVSKILKSDAVNKEMESSSDDDDLDDSDDPDKESIEPITTSINTQPIPSEQVKTEKGHKKAREEEMRAIKSKVMSLPSAPPNPSETITEDKVRSLLLQKQYMTFTELIQKFRPKDGNLRTKEVKEGIVQKLATILKRLNIEEKIIGGKKHIKLKST